MAGRSLVVAFLTAWIMVNNGHGFGIETSSNPDEYRCPIQEPLTLWHCLWPTLPGYPEVDGTNFGGMHIFADPNWDPIKNPVPMRWLRSLKPDDGMPEAPNTGWFGMGVAP